MVVHSYRIVVAGGLDDSARDALSAYEINRAGDDTALLADLDQASLFATLARINSLGLELVEVSRVSPPG